MRVSRFSGCSMLPTLAEGDVLFLSKTPLDQLKKGDIILEIQGEHIDQTRSLSSILQKYHVGDEIALKIFRDCVCSKSSRMKAVRQNMPIPWEVLIFSSR